MENMDVINNKKQLLEQKISLLLMEFQIDVFPIADIILNKYISQTCNQELTKLSINIQLEIVKLIEKEQIEDDEVWFEVLVNGKTVKFRKWVADIYGNTDSEIISVSENLTYEEYINLNGFIGRQEID